MSFSISQVLIILGFGLLIPSVYAQSQFPPVGFWEVGQFSFIAPSTGAADPDRFCNFTNGNFVTYGGGGNVAAWSAEETILWEASTVALIPNGQVCPADGICILAFESNGNLVSTFQGTPLWSSGTEGRGMWFVCQENAPWLYIVDGAGTVIWSTSST